MTAWLGLIYLYNNVHIDRRFWRDGIPIFFVDRFSCKVIVCVYGKYAERLGISPSCPAVKMGPLDVCVCV